MLDPDFTTIKVIKTITVNKEFWNFQELFQVGYFTALITAITVNKEIWKSVRIPHMNLDFTDITVITTITVIIDFWKFPEIFT